MTAPCLFCGMPVGRQVPELTEEMYEAAHDAWVEWAVAGRGTGFESVKVAIRAALAAAPLRALW